MQKLIFILDFLKRTWKQYQKELGDAAYKEYWGEHKAFVDHPREYTFYIHEHPITKHYYPIVYVTQKTNDHWFDGKRNVPVIKDYTHSYYINLCHYINKETKTEWFGVETIENALLSRIQPCFTREIAEKAIAIYKEQELEMGVVKTTVERLSMSEGRKLLK